MKNKILPYVIYGVPIAIGVYILINYMKKKRGEKLPESLEPNKPTPMPTRTPNIISTTYTKKDSLPFKKGIESVYVGVIQRKLGINDDNKFGNNTYNAVVKFQKSKGLTPDGIVGKNTWNAMFDDSFPNTGAFPQYPPMKEEPIKKFDPFNLY